MLNVKEYLLMLAMNDNDQGLLGPDHVLDTMC